MILQSEVKSMMNSIPLLLHETRNILEKSFSTNILPIFSIIIVCSRENSRITFPIHMIRSFSMQQAILINCVKVFGHCYHEKHFANLLNATRHPSVISKHLSKGIPVLLFLSLNWVHVFHYWQPVFNILPLYPHTQTLARKLCIRHYRRKLERNVFTD